MECTSGPSMGLGLIHTYTLPQVWVGTPSSMGAEGRLVSLDVILSLGGEGIKKGKDVRAELKVEGVGLKG